MTDILLLESLQKILHTVDEGIHIIDNEGITIYYNDSMSEIEGLDYKYVIGKHVLDVFPNWKKENSTLLTVLETGKEIIDEKQSYFNFKGEKIYTLNTTFPVYSGKKIIGAVEVARNLTNINEMNNKILSLQDRLGTDKKEKVDNTRNLFTFEDIIGESNDILEAIKIAKKSSETKSSVFIIGDTGTGKEMFAQSIHTFSSRSDEPFIGQNCSAIPDSLLESTLFGTSKGAFTGAIDRPGLFEQAHKGTLFLDEIDSMDVGLQAKLLRVLQESYVRRVGATKDKKVDVRVIAATNMDPSDLLNEGLIRKDLFYRLNVITLKLPRLCSRKKDIEILVKHFIKQYNNSLSKSVIRVQDEVMKIFKSYDWKGNVRELSNCVESIMAIMDDDSVIRLEHVPTYMMDVMTDSEVDIIDYKCGDDEDLNDILSRIEIDIIRKQLSQFGGNVSKTASKLGISRQNLQYKIKKYGL